MMPKDGQEPAGADTAVSHMVTNIPRALASTLAETVVAMMRDRRFDCADTIFVIDPDGRLEGIVRINNLLSDGHHRISEIMHPEHEAVRSDEDQEAVALLAMRLDMIAVPVVDEDNRLIGAVPPEALFRILRYEHQEDLQRLAGIAPHKHGPVVALDAPIRDRIRRRLPWLGIGLLASSAITFVMAGFEESLSARVEVAFFIPALVYIAGAIGAQAVSVAVRGLSSNHVLIGRLLREELVIGMVIGASLGLISAMMVLAAFGDAILSMAVGISVLGGGMISAVVGFGLPWLFVRLGFDPALGSGPICTIIQDVSALMIYFVLVSAFVL